jgi:predicted DNA binding CopG/RHH family protein
MNTNKEPQFETEEQEEEYWDAYIPLDLAAEPKAQKVRVRGAKDRPITIRLDSESRLKLSKLAAEQGIGPSTFARSILMSVIEHRGSLSNSISLDDLKEIVEQNLPQSIKDQAENLAKAVSIGELNNPAFLLLDRSQMNEWGELGSKVVSTLLAMYGIQVIAPEEMYEKAKTLVQSGT